MPLLRVTTVSVTEMYNWRQSAVGRHNVAESANINQQQIHCYSRRVASSAVASPRESAAGDVHGHWNESLFRRTALAAHRRRRLSGFWRRRR